MKIKKNGKPDLDSDDIEEFGIQEIEQYFKGHSRVKTNLAKCDKGQFWDGALFLYKEGGKIKENYVDKVSVQSKGETVKSIKVKKYSYDIDMEDLKAYMTDGTIYFVTQIAPTETKLFYRLLTPTLCQNIMRAHEGQKTAAVQMYEIPDDKEGFADLLGVFCNDCKKLATAIGKPSFNFQDLKKRNINTFTFCAPSNTFNNIAALEEYLINNDIYIYAQIDKELAIDYPIAGEPVNFGIGREIVREVKVNDDVFYLSYNVTRFADHVVVSVGNCLTLTLYYDAENNSKSKMTFKQHAKFLHDAVREMEFILAINKFKHIDVGGLTININSRRNDLISRYKAEVGDWKLLRGILDRLHVRKDLDLSVLKESDYTSIGALCETIGKNKPITLTDTETSVTTLSIGNLNLLLWIYVGKDNKCMFGDFFDDSARLYYKINDNANVEASHFSCLTEDYLNKIDNIPFEDVVEHYKQKETANPYIRDMATYDATAWLHICDRMPESDRKTEILQSAAYLYQWLIDTETDAETKVLLTIDLMQTYKRMRGLNDVERTQLTDICDDALTTNIAKSAITLLLDDADSFQNYYNTLTPEEQKAIDDDPISFFKVMENKK